ncbi:uncharacterized protein LOC113483861 isoform X1 [Athene cunicularia]|uniref:uncharacterized protein LOC113483861 isoform X1 n=1 Tax=Athene cunicularia TaxID=194338 RepID=UPI000EF6DB02|nr:uncharacterized protein LOC113483861 isoform X1 [Athene cunicularia]XP_026711636.1 uncharacterized protein LOC113483861 isoform X1 [Athene cunicularia]
MLTVMVLGVSHLLKGLQGSRGSYVKVYLLPRLLVSWQMVLQCSSLHPVRQEPCRLGRYSLEELRSFTLRFAIYARFRSLKGSFVGEVLFRCAQAIWDPQPSSSYSWELLSTKTQLRKCLSAHDTTRSVLSSPPKALSHLLLVPQYQAQSHQGAGLQGRAAGLALTCARHARPIRHHPPLPQRPYHQHQGDQFHHQLQPRLEHVIPLQPPGWGHPAAGLLLGVHHHAG